MDNRQTFIDQLGVTQYMEPRLSFKNRKELLALGSSFHMFEIFKSYQFNQEKARAYGFVENSGAWNYSCEILHGDFVMNVSVTDGKIDFQVFDQETGDLYPQVHMEV